MMIWGLIAEARPGGDVGPGRMLDPFSDFDLAVSWATPVNDLQTSSYYDHRGPTREALDPVRFISNHSSR